MASLIRRWVSQHKRRYQRDGFDLDLAYITPRIIAMGLPAEGHETLFRNPLCETARFLSTYHPGSFRVYNLCRERVYDVEPFGGAVVQLPLEDHQAAPLPLIQDFCVSAAAWLASGPERVVVVHCKAGKGRTGLMICALLLHLAVVDPGLANFPGPTPTAAANMAALLAHSPAEAAGGGGRGGSNQQEAAGESAQTTRTTTSSGGGSGSSVPPSLFGRGCSVRAHRRGLQAAYAVDLGGLVPGGEVGGVLALYAARRTTDDKGVTIASQRRFVGYYWQVLRQHQLPPPRPLQLRTLALTGCIPGTAAGLGLRVLSYGHGSSCNAITTTDNPPTRSRRGAQQPQQLLRRSSADIRGSWGPAASPLTRRHSSSDWTPAVVPNSSSGDGRHSNGPASAGGPGAGVGVWGCGAPVPYSFHGPAAFTSNALGGCIAVCQSPSVMDDPTATAQVTVDGPATALTIHLPASSFALTTTTTAAAAAAAGPAAASLSTGWPQGSGHTASSAPLALAAAVGSDYTAAAASVYGDGDSTPPAAGVGSNSTAAAGDSGAHITPVSAASAPVQPYPVVHAAAPPASTPAEEEVLSSGLLLPGVTLDGAFKVQVVKPGGGKPLVLAAAWLHTGFLPRCGHLQLAREQLDKVAGLPPGVALTLKFDEVRPGGGVSPYCQEQEEGGGGGEGWGRPPGPESGLPDGTRGSGVSSGGAPAVVPQGQQAGNQSRGGATLAPSAAAARVGTACGVQGCSQPQPPTGQYCLYRAGDQQHSVYQAGGHLVRPGPAAVSSLWHSLQWPATPGRAAGSQLLQGGGAAPWHIPSACGGCCRGAGPAGDLHTVPQQQQQQQQQVTSQQQPGHLLHHAAAAAVTGSGSVHAAAVTAGGSGAAAAAQLSRLYHTTPATAPAAEPGGRLFSVTPLVTRWTTTTTTTSTTTTATPAAAGTAAVVSTATQQAPQAAAARRAGVEGRGAVPRTTTSIELPRLRGYASAPASPGGNCCGLSELPQPCCVSDDGQDTGDVMAGVGGQGSTHDHLDTATAGGGVGVVPAGRVAALAAALQRRAVEGRQGVSYCGPGQSKPWLQPTPLNGDSNRTKAPAGGTTTAVAGAPAAAARSLAANRQRRTHPHRRQQQQQQQQQQSSGEASPRLEQLLAALDGNWGLSPQKVTGGGTPLPAAAAGGAAATAASLAPTQGSRTPPPETSGRPGSMVATTTTTNNNITSNRNIKKRPDRSGAGGGGADTRAMPDVGGTGNGAGASGGTAAAAAAAGVGVSACRTATLTHEGSQVTAALLPGWTLSSSSSTSGGDGGGGGGGGPDRADSAPLPPSSGTGGSRWGEGEPWQAVRRSLSTMSGLATALEEGGEGREGGEVAAVVAGCEEPLLAQAAARRRQQQQQQVTSTTNNTASSSSGWWLSWLVQKQQKEEQQVGDAGEQQVTGVTAAAQQKPLWGGAAAARCRGPAGAGSCWDTPQAPDAAPLLGPPPTPLQTAVQGTTRQEVPVLRAGRLIHGDNPSSSSGASGGGDAPTWQHLEESWQRSWWV